MKKLNFLHRIALVLLTSLFVVSMFLSFVISIKDFDEDPRFFFVGILFYAINIGSFFFITKILRKYYNYKQRKGLRFYYYLIIIMSTVSVLVVLAFNGRWRNMVPYFILAAAYFYLFEKIFGKFRLTINSENDKLLVGDLTSFNTDVAVIAKNKKVKSSTKEIQVGDIIRISKDGETIITLDVINNQK